MVSLSQQVLRTDLAGLPLEWVDYRTAARLYALGQVAYACGDRLFLLRGGTSAATRRRSELAIHSIIATFGHHHACFKRQGDYAPPLCNPTLFQRDDHICLYCGGRFAPVTCPGITSGPLSKGGKDRWNNVVTACVRCNNFKAGQNARGGRTGTPGGPLHPDPCRVHLSDGPRGPGGPDGIPAQPLPTQQPAACAASVAETGPLPQAATSNRRPGCQT